MVEWWGSEDGARNRFGINCRGCQNCKIPVNSTARHQSLLITTVLKKFLSGVSSLQVSSGWREVCCVILIWWCSFQCSVMMYSLKFVSWKRLSCWQIIRCLRDDTTSLFVCLYVFVTQKILVFLIKKIRFILHMTKMDRLLKSDKLMTFNKVRINILFLKIESRWRKNHEAVVQLILGLLLGIFIVSSSLFYVFTFLYKC